MSKHISLSSLFLVITLVLSAALKAENHRDYNIVFIGNSITYGANHPYMQRVQTCPPAQAVKWLSAQKGIGELHYSNQGYSGRTSYDFLPSKPASLFNAVMQAADSLTSNWPESTLIFSFMLGTNDTAERPTGGPSTPEQFKSNMLEIIEAIIAEYPDAHIVLNKIIPYSPGAHTIRDSRMHIDLLPDLNKELRNIVKQYKDSGKAKIYIGDTKAASYFSKEKNYTKEMYREEGFGGSSYYLHPTPEGSAHLGVFWAKSLYKIFN